MPNPQSPKTKAQTWEEFECPECTAHNPYPNGFRVGDELFCNWCGQLFLVRKDGDEGDRFKLVLG